MDATLSALPPQVEVVVVDGGSRDDTLSLARLAGAKVMTSPRGRARQMNAGVQATRGDILVFLHADTRLPQDFTEYMHRFAVSGRAWGCFNIRLSGSHPAFRLIEFMMNWRSRFTGICTGDQVLFMRRHAFERVGGFPCIALMEDIAISKSLKRVCRPWRCRGPVISASRRWEKHGILRTVLRMWCLRLSYFFGVSPERLAGHYYGSDAIS